MYSSTLSGLTRWAVSNVLVNYVYRLARPTPPQRLLTLHFMDVFTSCQLLGVGGRQLRGQYIASTAQLFTVEHGLDEASALLAIGILRLTSIFVLWKQTASGG